MCDMPECLSRRYQALDELINELSLVVASQDDCKTISKDINDASINLLCKFWNILKDFPCCNLSKEVRQRMGLDKKTAHRFRPQRLACYMAEQDDRNDSDKKNCCGHDQENKEPSPEASAESKSDASCNSRSGTPRSTTESPVLSKVLCDLKQAVSFDKKCNARIGELNKTQELLKEQIQQLESREKEGVQLLKQAECMWSCMEAAYQKKIKESLERQSEMLKQMNQVEISNTKWRKNKKDLEFQMISVDKCYQEITEKLHQKNNDVKCIKMNIDNFKKRIENSNKQIPATQKSFCNKKKASDAKIACLSAQITKAKKVLEDEQNCKRVKEIEGSNYVKEARVDLQRIYRLLLERKLENEDLRAEKEAIINELVLLKQSCEQCKDKCQSKELSLTDEIAKVDAEIASFKARCIRCHKYTDTADVRKLCTDCPRCSQERECLIRDGQCHWDNSMDCVCMSTKEKFMNNVFDNMYSILEQKAKTREGKAVGDAVLKCVQKSRNGKLNEPTRKLLQDFVITAAKKDLNLTIVGGAIKTRCEMDQETYKQLMLCLDLVKPTPPKKEDKAVSKREPCLQWGNVTECHCPYGPKDCICTKKGLYNPKDPESSPPESKENIDEKTICPTKESKTVEVECCLNAMPNAVGKEVASWRPKACNDSKCAFSKNMRAAQCVLGPDSLTTASKITGFQSKMPHIPDVSVLENQIVCKCGPTPTKPCACRTGTGTKQLKTEVEQCDKSTCAAALEQANDNLQRVKNKLQRTERSPPKLERSSTLLEDIKRRNRDSKKSSFGKRSRSNSAQSHPHDQLHNLKKTPSGSLAMELDKKVIKQIEEKLEEHPTIQASVKRSNSGHYIIDFNPSQDSQNTIFVFKKSRSGNLLMEKDDNTKDYTIVEENVSLDSKKDDNTVENIKNYTIAEENVALDSKTLRNNKSSLSVLDETKQSQVNLSNSTAVDIDKVPKHVCRPEFSKTSTHQRNIKKRSCLENVQSSHSKDSEKAKLFKLLIKDCRQSIYCLFAVLEATKSNDYILNVDKEYEKQFNKTMREHFGSDFECPIGLSKPSSGHIVIDFLENKDLNATPNALIIRSDSGNIRIITESVQPDINKSFSLDGKRASKVFSKMISQLSQTTTRERLKVPNLTDNKSNSDSHLLEKAKMQLQTQQQLLTKSSAMLRKTDSGHYAVILNKDSKKAFINNLKNFVSNNSQGRLPIKKTSHGEITIMLNNDTNETNQYGSLKISPSGNIFVLVDEDFLKKIDYNVVDSTLDGKASALSPKRVNVTDVVSKNVTTTCNAMPDNTCDSSKCICGEVIKHGVDDSRLDYFDAKCVKKFKFCSVEDSHHDCKKFKCHYKPSNRYSEVLKIMDVSRYNLPDNAEKVCPCRPINSLKKKKSDNHQLFYMYQSVNPFLTERFETVSCELLEISETSNNVIIAPQLDSDEMNGIANNNTASNGKSSGGTSQRCHCDSGYLDFLPPQLPPFLVGFLDTRTF